MEAGEPILSPAMNTARERRLHDARHKAHQMFDQLWMSGRMSRGKAYRWLQKEMGMTKDEAHFSKFDDSQCALVQIKLMKSEHADLFL